MFKGVDVQLTFPSRRAFGILAAGTIGLSTALLGVTGVVNASPDDVVEAEAELAAVLAPPPAPDYLEVDTVGDGSVTLSFLVYDSDPGIEADTTGYEISTNNGSSFAAFATQTPYGNNEHVGTVTGLTNKQTYDLVVRSTSSVGPSANTDPVQATPAKPIGAPVGPHRHPGPGQGDRQLVRTDRRRLLRGGHLRRRHLPAGHGRPALRGHRDRVHLHR